MGGRVNSIIGAHEVVSEVNDSHFQQQRRSLPTPDDRWRTCPISAFGVAAMTAHSTNYLLRQLLQERSRGGEEPVMSTDSSHSSAAARVPPPHLPRGLKEKHSKLPQTVIIARRKNKVLSNYMLQRFLSCLWLNNLDLTQQFKYKKKLLETT